MTLALPWHEVERRVSERIEDLRSQLETASPDDVRYLQGQIAGLRYVESLPLKLPDPDKQIGDPAEI